MPGCSTASLGALSLAGRGLGAAFIGHDPQCAELSGDVARNPSLYDDAKAIALGLGWRLGTPPVSGGDGGNGGNGNDTAMWGFLSSLVGAVPGMIHGATPGTPPPLVQQPAARTGMVMLPLIAVGVVVWMLARGRSD